ncbi:MAG TPA: hypothetical protein VFV38_23840 [Ktedonobacteraceae bacterium]|nr:hypothetical protein [Ktedonobacteraceae bacterium]
MQTNDQVPLYRVFLFGRMRLERLEATGATGEPHYQPYVPAGWDRQSPWRVLAYLLTRTRRQTHRDPLIEALWPDSPLERARRACSVAISQLRLGLRDRQGEALVTPRKTDDHQLIHLADQEYIWCDWHAFTHLLAQAQQDALALWEKAYALSREEFLLNERYQDWCSSLRERTAGDQRLCVLRLAACYSLHDRSADEEVLLRQFLTDFPQDEDILCRLLALLIPQGRFQEALRWGQRTQEALEDEGMDMQEQTKELMKRLHAKQRPSPFPLERSQDILQRQVSAPVPWSSPEKAAQTLVFDRATLFTVTVCGLVQHWQSRATECAALQDLLSKEFAMFEHEALEQHAGEVTPLSRRQALVALAALPYGALAAAKLAGSEIAPEAFLPQATAAITSCWSIMQQRDFPLVQQALAHCLPALTTLAQKKSPYQFAAASLAAQGNLLLGLVVYHQQPHNMRQRSLYCRQAVNLAEPLPDPTLRILSLCHLGSTEGYLERFPEMLAALEEAMRLSVHELVSPSLRRKVLGELAYAYARAGQVQQALQHYGDMKTSVAPASDEAPVYLQDSGLVVEDIRATKMFETLGRHTSSTIFYQRAWKAMDQVEQRLPAPLIPERFRIEGINQKALVALRLGELDQFVNLTLQGIQGAKALQSEKRRQEIIANWKEARKVWPREPQITELADALVE